MGFTLNADSVGTALSLQQNLDSLYDNIQSGDVLGVIADISNIATTVAAYELQVGLSITSTGLNLSQAMSLANQGNLQPKDVLAVSNAIMGGFAALGVVLAAPEALAAASTAALFVGVYGVVTGTPTANKILQDLSQCASSGSWQHDLANGNLTSFELDALLKGYYDNGTACISIDAASNFTAAQSVLRYDPLTLDLNGNGIETVAPDPLAPILFDHDGDGVATGTGWIAPTDGYLVMDRDGNGSIDDGTELFGDNTNLYDAEGNITGKAADGFAALAQQDSNHDGVVDAQDANYAMLGVWQDLNQDGVSQAGEVKTLAELGIASINVGKTENSQMLAGGNEIADLGSFTYADGTTGTAGTTSGLADVNLAADTFHRSFSDVIPTTELTENLPDTSKTCLQVLAPQTCLQVCGVFLSSASLDEWGMQGSGLVRDLREAASLSQTLQSLLAANDAVFEMRGFG